MSGGGGFCPGGFCPGGFVRGGFVRGGFVRGGFVRGGFVRGGFVRGVFVRGGFVRGGFVQGGFCPGGFCPGGFCPRGVLVGGFCPGGFCLGGFCPRILILIFILSLRMQVYLCVVHVSKVSWDCEVHGHGRLQGRGGGGGNSKRSPLLENQKNCFRYFISMWGSFLLCFSPYGYLFIMWGAFFGLASSPTKISAGVHVYRVMMQQICSFVKLTPPRYHKMGELCCIDTCIDVSLNKQCIHHNLQDRSSIHKEIAPLQIMALRFPIHIKSYFLQ